MNNVATQTMEAALRQQLQQLGVVGDATILDRLAQNQQVCLVEQGYLDVFIVVANAVRSHLFTVNAGQLFIPPLPPADSSEQWMFKPSTDIRFHVLAQKDLLNTLTMPAWRDAAATLIDQSIHTITIGFEQVALIETPARAQVSNKTLTPGRNYGVADQDVTLIAPKAGTWVELASGQANYLAMADLKPMYAMPLPCNLSLTLRANSALDVFTTDEILARPALPEENFLGAISALTIILLHAKARQKQQNSEAGLSRLQTRKALNDQAMTDALTGFASLFDAKSYTASSSHSKDRTLNACKIIGSAMGIHFKAPPSSSQSTSGADSVSQIAQASGIRTRKIALKDNWWQKEGDPILVFLEEGGEAFALLPLPGGRYQVVHPATGEKTIVNAQFAEKLNPFAFVFYRRLPLKKLTGFDVLQFFAFGIQRDIINIVLIGLASVVLGMAVPIASGYLFDVVFPAADIGQLMHIVIMLFVASWVTLLFEATRSFTLLRIEGRAGSYLQAAIWDRVLSLPVPFFRQYSAGDLANRINGIQDMQQALSNNTIVALIGGLFSVLNIFLLFYYSAKLAFIALLLALVVIGFFLVIAYLSYPIRLRHAEIKGKVAGLVFEYLNGIAKLRVTGAEARGFANWADQFTMQNRLAFQIVKLFYLSVTFYNGFPIVAYALILACIALPTAQDGVPAMTTGDFIAFSAAWTSFLGGIMVFMTTGTDVLMASQQYERTRPILEALPEFDENKPHPGTLSGALELNNIHFSYAPEAPAVLNNISINIKAGEFIALVGASGSGKSTLLRLLLGFEKPDQGGIYYDGQNLNDVDVGAIRRQLGVVLQNGKLTSGDILSNIIVSNTLSTEDAWSAIRACDLEQDIKAMPMGIHTIVSDSGGTLSGGQRQRLLIARAIVNKPRIIIFDEATSALDNQSQAIVSASIEKLHATRIVVAHRISTITNADCIYVLDQGKIVQSGTYQQLLNQDGLFAELAKRQIA
jgi:NHLM bacteriocin system ABC transporter ATP-binding protein